MADDKKYYYLKLKENFFDSDAMIVLESMPDGYLYSNILLKLLCRGDYYKRGYRVIDLKTSNASILKFISSAVRVDSEKTFEAIEVLRDLNLIEFTVDKIIVRDLNIDLDRNRCSKKYKEWRRAVFERDDYTCKKCGFRGVKLNAHHIKEWAIYPDHRFLLENGVTLCEKCHRNKKELTKWQKKNITG